jgi:hypothetical protein
MKQLLHLKTAPIGLGAYFAYQVGIFEPQLFGAYAETIRSLLWSLWLSFVNFFSFYAFIAGGTNGLKVF